MTWRGWLLALLILLCWVASLYAVYAWRGEGLFPTRISQASISDAGIRAGLVGSWVVARKDGEQGDQLRSVTEFDANGTGMILMYSDLSCTRVIQRIPFVWSVGRGQLIYYAQGGRPAAAEIVHIGLKQFLLRGDDGETRRRERANSCARH